MNKTGVVCPHCGVKSDSSPCDNCGEYIERYGKEPEYERFMYDYEPLQPDEFRVGDKQ